MEREKSSRWIRVTTEDTLRLVLKCREAGRQWQNAEKGRKADRAPQKKGNAKSATNNCLTNNGDDDELIILK